MNSHKILILLLPLCILLSTQTQAQPEIAAGANTATGVPTITITKLEVNDKTLELGWEIRNDTGQDAWILAGIGSGACISAFMDKDDQTLMIRRRLDVPAHPQASFPDCRGRYSRLRAGQTLAESVSLAIPVYPQYAIGVIRRKARGLEYATRLSIEIGYYTGDLPGMIRRVLERVDKLNNKPKNRDDRFIKRYFGGSLNFNSLNELVRSRDDNILIPFTSQAFTGEQVLLVTAEDLHIPYEEKEYLSERHPPDLVTCTRVEIQFKPSMLEYFFPYAGQQRLLSPAEKEYLQSMKTIVVENPDNLKALADDVNKGIYMAEIVRQRSAAHVVCYRDDERLMSFPIYNDNSIVTEGRYRFELLNDLRSLRVLTPQIQAIELRLNCAANLKNLWYRFRLYEKAAKPGFLRRRKKPYPAPNIWCDSMLRAYRDIEMNDEYLMMPHICPSAGHGKCHYAMNPNCKPDSPPDMVLLFETKGGWNQHGGLELFTFDNHDPRGGCVLLNDGTVKFIRTTEEFQQLRWK